MPLVMLTDQRGDRTNCVRRFQVVGSARRMRSHFDPLFAAISGPGLTSNALVHCQLPDVVQPGGIDDMLARGTRSKLEGGASWRST